MNFVQGAVDDADVILYVTDTVEQSDRSESIIEKINRSGIPTIVVINKIDREGARPLEVLDEQSIVAGYKGKTPISVPIDNQLTLTVNQFENMCRYPNKSYSQLKGKIYSLINLIGEDNPVVIKGNSKGNILQVGLEWVG